MLAKLTSYALMGLDGYKVDIEIDVTAGMPTYNTVGLPDATIKESKDRVYSAIKNSLLPYPNKRITINLAPADSKKEGAAFDLAIAIGLLVASEKIESPLYRDFIILGELGLDGNVKQLNGIMPLLISAMQEGYTKFIIPHANAKEASYVPGITAYAVKSLSEIVEFLCGNSELSPVVAGEYKADNGINKYSVDFKEVKGQYVAKRALEISVAGGHNVLLIGPPGAGKTLMAKCVPTIMPDMTYEEAVEVTKIHSIAGVLDSGAGIVTQRPFRTPHHTVTVPALMGGGANARPGEVSLAHNGVLFLDELPEYQRRTLETLRQPLEDGAVTVSRSKLTLDYPAKFMLVASMNPCPCGNLGSKKLVCRCSPAEIHRYIGKLSGPLMDRIDLQIVVDSVSYDELRCNTEEEDSKTIKQRVDRAREIQRHRYKGSGIYTNSNMTNAMVKKYCKLTSSSELILQKAFEKLNLTARATTRILKVARTIADLAGDEDIKENHIMEAINYRSLDRKYWE